MNQGIAFLFDLETETAIRGIWQSIANAGLLSFMLGVDYPPHLTVFMAEELELPGLRAAFGDLTARTPPVPVSFPALAHFLAGADVSYLAPLVNHALLDLHAAFWQAAGPFSHGRAPYYAPGVWVPHVTVAYNTPPEQVGPLTEVLAQVKPFSGLISAVVIGSFNPQGGSQIERIEFTG